MPMDGPIDAIKVIQMIVIDHECLN
jgi:hypothetical protein